MLWFFLCALFLISVASWLVQHRSQIFSSCRSNRWYCTKDPQLIEVRNVKKCTVKQRSHNYGRSHTRPLSLHLCEIPQEATLGDNTRICWADPQEGDCGLRHKGIWRVGWLPTKPVSPYRVMQSKSDTLRWYMVSATEHSPYMVREHSVGTWADGHQ